MCVCVCVCVFVCVCVWEIVCVHQLYGNACCEYSGAFISCVNVISFRLHVNQFEHMAEMSHNHDHTDVDRLD